MFGRIRACLPHAAVTSDFIVGFCGETEDDFQKTYDLAAECRFKNSFIFKYSERPGTKGAELYADDVPYEVKNRRNNELLELQNRISEQDSQQFLGARVEVLVEGASDRAKHRGEDHGDLLQLTGRTPDDRIAVFDGNPRLIGQIIPVAIYDVSPHTLFGAVVTEHVGADLQLLS
jgi:tRNA-2-methylthio-N6-dimethylallyladenosine synthase